MKPVAYKNVTEATTVAKCAGGRLLLVASDLCEDAQEGLLVVTPDHKLWDENGVAFYATHECVRYPRGEMNTPEYKPGKWALRLENAEEKDAK